MTHERRTIRFADCGIEVRATESGKPPRIVGYPIVFDSLSEPIGGKFRERVRPEAVKRYMAGAPDVRCLMNHESGMVLAAACIRTPRRRRSTTRSRRESKCRRPGPTLQTAITGTPQRLWPRRRTT